MAATTTPSPLRGMSDTTLRLRRAFTAPGHDDSTDSSRPVEILDHSGSFSPLKTDEAFVALTSITGARAEQAQLVDELVDQARRSARRFRAAGAGLTAVVLSCAPLLLSRSYGG